MKKLKLSILFPVMVAAALTGCRLSDVKSELSSGGKPVKLGVLQKYIGKQATYCNLLINANTGIINIQKEALRVLAIHSSMYKNK